MSAPDQPMQDGDLARPGALLSAVDWESVGAEVRQQQRRRERYTPPISLFRWWARRSHALIGAVLEQAHAEDAQTVISDPLSGGGTVAIESARRGLTVYAQDLHPWPVAGLRAALTPVEPSELENASTRLLDSLEGLRAELYGSTCPAHGQHAEVLGCFWVRVTPCPGCERAVHLFPYAMVSRASRSVEETHSWWGCSACGARTRSRDDAQRRRCSGCGKTMAPASRSLLGGRRVTCPHRGCQQEFAVLTAGRAQWSLVLVNRACRVDGRLHVHIDRPSAEEARGAEALSSARAPNALREQIPRGLETRVLRRAGFERWEQLYTVRQIRVLSAAAEQIDSLRVSAAVRDRLRLSLAGCAEMAGHVCRWDRFYPKAFEAMSNHRFAVTGLSYESNLLADRGRGTLPRRLAHSVSAARWSQDELPQSARVRHSQSSSRRRAIDGLHVVEGSSIRQLARDETVDLVLTDPPYFDDVQYAELAGVFLAWARASHLLPDSAELDLRSEAVANSTRGVGAVEYRDLLAAIFIETRRTLRPRGRLILTYHNTDLRAWWALGSALQEAGMNIHALAVTYAENERDHAKRDRLGFSRDLVIECRATSPSAEPQIVWYEHDEPEARELVAAGRALAAMAHQETLSDFRDGFRRRRGNLTVTRISPRDGDHDCEGERIESVS